jgi:hypothetical protein
MDNEDFLPSGEWTGFYQQFGAQFRTNLSLSFAAGRLRGEGIDGVGAFVVAGRYDANTNDVHWTKSYLGAHEVLYRGCRDGKAIWGVWEIPGHGRGGFKIWPRNHATAEAAAAAAKDRLAPTSS